MFTPWENFAYYLSIAERKDRLAAWHEQWRKILHQLELPFLYAGIVRAFVDKDSQDYAIVNWLYKSHNYTWLDRPYSDQIICNAIRLGLYGSLKEHHKNRTAVEAILKKVFANNWAQQYQNAPEDIVMKELEQRVREYTLSHT